MAVLRGPLPADNYTLVSNDWARDPKLSLKAKGLLLAISSHKQGYRLTIQQLIAQNRDGRDGIYAGLRELVDAGYMVVIQNRHEDGRMAEVDYQLTGKLGQHDDAAPVEGEEQPRSKKRRRSSEPFTENPDTAAPASASAEPYAENPDTAAPDTAAPDTAAPDPADPPLRRSTPKKITKPRKTNHVTSTSARDVELPVDNLAIDPDAVPARGLAVVKSDDPTADVDGDEVERILMLLPDRLHPTTGDLPRLRNLIEQRMRRGWTREAILEAVDRRLRPGPLDNPCGLFAKRLVPLDEAPPGREPVLSFKDARKTAAPWCGECDERTRWVLDEQGVPDPTQPRCTDCAQLAFAQHMERGAS